MNKTPLQNEKKTALEQTQSHFATHSIARLIAFFTRRGARLLTGARSLWIG